MAKSKADWERIETDYRAGTKSIREIAAEHGISDTAIRKTAKAEEWSRDLAPRITARADALVRQSQTDGQGERLIIESNAQAIANVKLAHRADIRRGREIAANMLDELGTLNAEPALIDQLEDALRDNSPDDHDKLLTALRRVTSLPQRSKVLLDLANAMKTIIGLERESYGLAEAQKLEISGNPHAPVQLDASLSPADAYLRMIGK